MAPPFAPATDDRYHLKTLHYRCIACILQPGWITYLLSLRLVGGVNRYRGRHPTTSALLVLGTCLPLFLFQHNQTASLLSQRDTNINNNNNTILPTDSRLWDPGISDYALWAKAYRIKQHNSHCERSTINGWHTAALELSTVAVTVAEACSKPQPSTIKSELSRIVVAVTAKSSNKTLTPSNRSCVVGESLHPSYK